MGLNKLEKRKRVKRRVRKSIFGTSEKPRLSVFRSNKEIYAQLIDDEKSNTLVSASSRVKGFAKGTKIDQAKEVGSILGKKAVEAGIDSVVFDRNGYIYHGRVKALAEGAREGGLKF